MCSTRINPHGPRTATSLQNEIPTNRHWRFYLGDRQALRPTTGVARRKMAVLANINFQRGRIGRDFDDMGEMMAGKCDSDFGVAKRYAIIAQYPHIALPDPDEWVFQCFFTLGCPTCWHLGRD